MPKFKMLVQMSGTRDGVDWPPVGGVVELPAGEGAKYVRGGLVEPVKGAEAPVEAAAVSEPVEAATVPASPRKATTRTRQAKAR